MFRISLIAALALALNSAAFAASGDFFVNGGVGQSNYRVANGVRQSSGSVSEDKKDTAYALRFGYRWHSVIDYGAEIGYVDIGRLEIVNQGVAQSTHGIHADYRVQDRLQSKGYLLGGNLKYDFGSDWYISARAGWFRSRLQEHVSNTFLGHTGYTSTYTHGIGEYAGVGAGYNFGRSFSLGLNYDNYHSRAKQDVLTSFRGRRNVNTAVYAISAEYRF